MLEQLLSFVAAAPLVAGAIATPAAVDPPAGQFTVQSINGTGCRATDTQVRPRDLTRLDISFTALAARQGGDAAPAARRSSCTVTLRAPAVRGYTFGVDNIVLRGRAALPAGTTGIATASGWFTGQPRTASTDRTIPGPWYATWDLRRFVRPTQISWMPCGAPLPLNLRVDVWLSARGANPGIAQITTNPGTNEPSASYRFAWKRC
jgi:hypothetical protein